jgi:chromosome segregation ATPase
MGKYINLIFMIIVAQTAGISGAFAQGADLDSISEKLSRLERDIQVLSRRVYKGKESSGDSSKKVYSVSPSEGGIGSANIIRLEDRLADLRGELQNSTNRMESISHNLDGIKVRLDKLVSDIDFRLARLESVVSRVRGGSQLTKDKDLSSVTRTTDVKRIGPATGGPRYEFKEFNYSCCCVIYCHSM